MKSTFKKQIIALLIGSSVIFASPSVFAVEQKSSTIKLSENIILNNNLLDNYKKEDINLNLNFKNPISTSTTIFGLPQNMGPIDRVLRGVIAAGLIGTGVYGLSTGNLNNALSYSLIGLSAIPIATAASGYCPLYQVFSVDYSF